MKKSLNRGFTLIELLVVIAIIGILSGIVLSSLSTARSKANDARTQEQLNNLRSAAEIYYSSNNNYGKDTAAGDNVCNQASGDTAGLYNILLAANWPGSAAPNCTTDAGGSSAATKWSAYHVLSSDSTKTWCVDSSGQSKQETNTTWTAPTLGAVCP